MNHIKLKTERTIIRFLEVDEANLALQYFQRNKKHLERTMPQFSPDFFELPFWVKRLEKNFQEFSSDSSCRLFILSKQTNLVIGTINFTDISRGVYQGCFLGYGIDEDYEGQGVMSECLKSVVGFVMKELNIHKVLANYMPWNKASGRVLEKLGFHEVGLAKQELFLDGKWQDHIETRLINSNWKNTLNSGGLT